MNTKHILNKLIKCAALGSVAALCGCSLINEDLDECTDKLIVNFVYDYNLKFSNAFPQEVKSVNVWAFDSNGAFVWSGSASGEALRSEDFAIETPLPAGTYDFLSWCGLKDNDDFNLATYTPTSKEELEVKLKTIESNSDFISSSFLPSLYHGYLSSFTYTVNPKENSVSTATIPLIKDTNNIRIMLQKYNGDEISAEDFEVKITIPDAWLAWNNDVLPSGPTVTYEPWETKYGTASMPDPTGQSETITSISSLLYEFSSSRLIAGANAILTVVRTSDNVPVIRIPIIEYFLMVMGHYEKPDGTPLTDAQEYLDRQDDYSILFFIDENNGWYMGYGIYINKWAVVPPQNQPL